MRIVAKIPILTLLLLAMRTFSIITIPFIVVSYCFLAVCAGFANESRSNWATEAYQKNCDSVIFIQGDKVEERAGNSTDSERTFNGMGTGVVIDERGYIITNYHVVKDIRKIQVTTYDQKQYIAALVAKDTDTDLAIIKVNVRSPLQPIVFGRSHDLMPGEACMAIGNPYGYAFSLTDGRISAINREVGVNDSALVYRLAMQTNTAINPGNSGGPLINVNGEMIGINVAIRQGATGIAFATPVDQVVEVAGKLIGELVDQQVVHGLTVSQIEPKNYEAIKQFIIKVDAVESNSPAALAGIQKGDYLTGIGKYTLKSKLDFYRALIGLKANEEIAFSFFRNNESFDVVVAVGAPKNRSFANRNISPQPAAVSPKTTSNSLSTAERDKQVWENFGIRYTPIPAQEYKRMYPQFILAQNKEFPDGGVLVKTVRSGSPAERAALATGDIILSIDGWAIASADNVRYVGAQEWATLQSENESIQADIIRDNKHFYTKIPMK